MAIALANQPLFPSLEKSSLQTLVMVNAVYFLFLYFKKTRRNSDLWHELGTLYQKTRRVGRPQRLCTNLNNTSSVASTLKVGCTGTPTLCVTRCGFILWQTLRSLTISRQLNMARVGRTSICLLKKCKIKQLPTHAYTY